VGDDRLEELSREEFLDEVGWFCAPGQGGTYLIEDPAQALDLREE
jgi:hypothetical protein